MIKEEDAKLIRDIIQAIGLDESKGLFHIDSPIDVFYNLKYYLTDLSELMINMMRPDGTRKLVFDKFIDIKKIINSYSDDEDGEYGRGWKNSYIKNSRNVPFVSNIKTDGNDELIKLRHEKFGPSDYHVLYDNYITKNTVKNQFVARTFNDISGIDLGGLNRKGFSEKFSFNEGLTLSFSPEGEDKIGEFIMNTFVYEVILYMRSVLHFIWNKQKISNSDELCAADLIYSKINSKLKSTEGGFVNVSRDEKFGLTFRLPIKYRDKKNFFFIIELEEESNKELGVKTSLIEFEWDGEGEDASEKLIGMPKTLMKKVFDLKSPFDFRIKDMENIFNEIFLSLREGF